MPDGLELIDVSRRLLAVGLLLRSVEVLLNAAELGRERLLGWWPPPHPARRWLTAAEAWASSRLPTLAVIAGRVAVAGFLLAAPLDHPLLPWAAGFLLISQLYVNRRLRRIHHSADVMHVYGLAAVFAALLAPDDPALVGISLAFLGAQAALAYLAAGLVKIRDRDWRTGATPAAIYRPGAHGYAPIGSMLAANPSMSAAAAWLIAALELALPASLFLPAPAFLVMLTAAAGFHLSMAVLMGLHSFFWAFLASYPGLYFLHAWLTAGR